MYKKKHIRVEIPVFAEIEAPAEFVPPPQNVFFQGGGSTWKFGGPK